MYIKAIFKQNETNPKVVILSFAGDTVINLVDGDNYGGILKWDYVSGKPTFATVATSGRYSDLQDRPQLSTVATSGAYSDLSGKPTDNAGYVSKSHTVKNQNLIGSGDIKLWCGSQAQYLAIISKDSNTIYFIV